MHNEKLIGTLAVRVATPVLAALATLGFLIWWQMHVDVPGWFVPATIVCALLALLGAIHCTRWGYDLWMRFARGLSEVMTTLVFGLSYLLLVPLFLPFVWYLDPLRLRRGHEPATFWHDRPSAQMSDEAFRRMG